MQLSLPLVSVIIPAYNAEAFIGQTLESVLSQTYKNIEVLVVDDGSQDKTPEIVTSFAERDRRVTLLQQQNKGVAAARNLAIEKSSGEYIAPVDADDIWYPLKLEKQVQCMLEADASVGLVYCWATWIDEQGLIIEKNYRDYARDKPEGNIYAALVYRNFVDNASTALIRRTCLEKVGSYNYELKENNAQGCEDWDLYLRIAEYYAFAVVPEFLVGYRQFAGSMSNNSRSMAKSYDLVMAESQQRHPEIPSSVYKWSRSYFYNYLLGKSLSCGDHWSSLLYLFKALQSDVMLLLRPIEYWFFVACVVKIAAKPLTSLIWQNHASWLQFKQRFGSNQASEKQEMTIADVNQEVGERQRLVKPYDKVLLQRWSQVMQLCQEERFSEAVK